MKSAAAILATLDASARAFVFPMLDNGYVFLAATRLGVHRSADDWAVTFEVFGYSPRAGYPDLSVVTIGSTIRRQTSAAEFVDDDAWRAYLRNNAHWENRYYVPVAGDWIDPATETVDPAAAELLLRGRPVPLPSPAAHAAAGVVLGDPGQIEVHEVCRTLAFLHRGDVLATEAERRANLPAGMAQLLLLDEWTHPDIVDADCLPSGTPAFRQIAEAIVDGDPSRYVSVGGNTHWSNWPDGGML